MNSFVTCLSRRITGFNDDYLYIKKYVNVHFFNVILEKQFYTRLEKIAEKLGTTSGIIRNVLLLTLKMEEKH